MKKIRYETAGNWSDWMKLDDWVTGLENCSAVEVKETLTKAELREHFPEVYAKHFTD